MLGHPMRSGRSAAIAAEGNYAEIFDRYLGAGSLLGLPRGLNALYADGGILYSPPFR